MRTCYAGLIGLWVLALASAAHAQTVERITISDPGLYGYETEKVEDAPNSVRGIFRTVRNQRLIEQTERVPGLIGTSFGVNFDVAGKPNGESVTLRLITRFPAPGLRDPKTGKLFLTSENDRQFKIGQLAFRSFTFDESWEIMPGTWSFEFWFGGKLLATQKFEVVKADPAPVAPPSMDVPGER
jgi:hypothetical protein